jgi:hypothetical protein
VHGEDPALNALAEGLKTQDGFERVDIPDLHQSFNV